MGRAKKQKATVTQSGSKITLAGGAKFRDDVDRVAVGITSIEASASGETVLNFTSDKTAAAFFNEAFDDEKHIDAAGAEWHGGQFDGMADAMAKAG